MDTWRQRVKQLKQETYALYLAYKDPRVPWYARVWLALVVGYAFSPIDLIPDFIPILGYLDDLILIPAGIWLALKLIPPQVLDDCRAQAAEKLRENRPVSWGTAVLIITIWLILAAILIGLVIRAFQ
jgi:uncharacterized membrane protein YkvA (DUF1232 family)